ncbi:MAG: hypothetical protein JWQ04_88 [Pedosphaera sp.]|nr:hypothetical protein [Pedosphaera sp.]
MDSDTLIARAKKRLGVDTDSALCRRIGYDRQSFAAVKNKRRAVPIPLEIKLRNAAGESADEIIKQYL